MPRRKVKPMDGKRAERMSVQFEEPADQDYINTLDDDCLARIFMYLPIRDKFIVLAVCKRWNENPDIAWRELKILDCTRDEFTPIPKTGRAFNRILKLCGRFLQQLKLVDHVTSSIMPIIARRCQNLEKIEIKLPWEEEETFRWYPKMEKLEYFKFRGNPIHFDKHLFSTLPSHNLTELHLSARTDRYTMLGLANLSNDFHTMLKNLPKLSALSLEGFRMDCRTVAAIHEKSTLTRLSITNSRHFNIPIDGRGFLNHLINLEYLDLRRIKELMIDYITLMVGTCKKLKYLNLSVSPWMNNNVIHALRGLPQLEELMLNGNPDIADAPLREMFNLRKLECQDCGEVGDAGIITLLRYAPNLEYLNLADSGVSGQVLTVAIEVMRQRTNGVELRMVISSRLRRSINQDNLPPLLILEDPANRSYDIHHTSYDEEDDEEDVSEDDVEGDPDFQLR